MTTKRINPTPWPIALEQRGRAFFKTIRPLFKTMYHTNIQQYNNDRFQAQQQIDRIIRKWRVDLSATKQNNYMQIARNKHKKYRQILAVILSILNNQPFNKVYSKGLSKNPSEARYFINILYNQIQQLFVPVMSGLYVTDQYYCPSPDATLKAQKLFNYFLTFYFAFPSLTPIQTFTLAYLVISFKKLQNPMPTQLQTWYTEGDIIHSFNTIQIKNIIHLKRLIEIMAKDKVYYTHEYNYVTSLIQYLTQSINSHGANHNN